MYIYLRHIPVPLSQFLMITVTCCTITSCSKCPCHSGFFLHTSIPISPTKASNCCNFTVRSASVGMKLKDISVSACSCIVCSRKCPCKILRVFRYRRKWTPNALAFQSTSRIIKSAEQGEKKEKKKKENKKGMVKKNPQHIILLLKNTIKARNTPQFQR